MFSKGVIFGIIETKDCYVKDNIWFFTTQSRLFTTLGMKAFENIVGKRRKCW